jgi:hypothetical protein
MIQGRIIKTVKVGIGGKEENVNEKIVYPVYEKDTGNEVILQHGIDAKEYLLSGRYVAFPPDGKERPSIEVVKTETETEEVLLPKVSTGPVRQNRKIVGGESS